MPNTDSGTAQTARQVRNRLRRAQGQLNAVIDLVEAGASCRDVVTQLAAVTHALDRAGFLLLSSALQECVQAPTKRGDTDPDALTVEEIEKLFLTLS